MKLSNLSRIMRIPVRALILAVILAVVFTALVANVGVFRSSANYNKESQLSQLKGEIYAFPKEDLLPGAKQSYTLVITNSSSQKVNNVRLRAAIPAELEMLHVTDGKYDSSTNTASWNVAKLAPGQSATVSFMAKLTSHVRAGEKLEVQFFGAGDGISEERYGSLATQVGLLPEGPKANITTFQTVSEAHPRAGEEAVFHVIVHNDGQAMAQGVVISEKLPKGLELLPDSVHPHLTNFAASTEPAYSYDANSGVMQVKVDNLMPNEWVALMFSAKVRKNIAVGTRIKAEAVVDSQVPQIHAIAPVEFQTGVAAAAKDFNVTVAADKTNAAVGDKLTYTITIDNNKSSNIAKLKITNKIPQELSLIAGSSTTSCGLKIVEAGDKGQVLWKKGTLPASGSCVVTFKATIVSAGNGTITNTATGKAPGSGTGSANAQTMVQVPNAATVDLMDNFFSPTTLMVSPGTLVTWSDKGNAPHTITGAPCNTMTFVSSDDKFPNGLKKGDSYSYTIPSDAKSGSVIYYFCRFHGSAGNCTSLGPGMAGMLVVK